MVARNGSRRILCPAQGTRDDLINGHILQVAGQVFDLSTTRFIQLPIALPLKIMIAVCVRLPMTNKN